MAKNRIMRAIDALSGRDIGGRSDADLIGKQRSLGRGGLYNAVSGAGGPADKAAHGYFLPTIFSSRTPLETIYVESWAAAKFINIPVDDSLIRWRRFDADDDDTVERMQDAERRHDVRGRLARAMKMGRLYGTGLLVMVTREAPLEEPLVVERVREGDLVQLLPVDRFDATVERYDTEFLSPTFGQPLLYRIQPRILTAGADPVLVHASRVLRFDGCRPLSVGGWDANYDSKWGVSELVPVLTSIIQDASLASGIAHLAQEASMLVVKMQGFRDAITGQGGGPEDPTPAQIGEAMNLNKSLWRTIFTDKDSEIDRINVTWAGLPDLLDRFHKRLSAAADIPGTRFMGQSPLGMNATGDSDLRNYALRVAAMQERLLTDPLSRLDKVLARDAGLTDPPKYTWRSLMDMSEQDQAMVAKTRAEAVNIALQAGLIDEDEGRAAIDGDPVFGELPGDAPEAPEPEPMSVPMPVPLTEEVPEEGGE